MHFFRARDAAIEALDTCERVMGPAGTPLSLARLLPESVRDALDAAQRAASTFVTLVHDSRYHASGLQFCRELAAADHANALKQLVVRDGRVLRLSGNEVICGMAFDGRPAGGEAEAQDGDEATAGLADRIRLPSEISFRMRNLFLLDLDLQSKLGDWLAADPTR